MKKSNNIHCKYCNCENPLMMTKDHIIPKSLGGTDEESNIQTVCWVCNQLKGSLTHKQFLEYRKALKILVDLKKIRFDFPHELSILFKQNHYPDHKYKIPIKEANKNEI